MYPPGFLSSWIWFLGVFVIAKTGYSASLVFYDAMLTDVTEPERMDSVSSHGYAWGYIGSCIPFVGLPGRRARRGKPGTGHAGFHGHRIPHHGALVAVLLSAPPARLPAEVFCRSGGACGEKQFPAAGTHLCGTGEG